MSFIVTVFRRWVLSVVLVGWPALSPDLAAAEELPRCNAIFNGLIDQTGHYCNTNQNYRYCGGRTGEGAGKPCRAVINPSMCQGEFYNVYCESLTGNSQDSKVFGLEPGAPEDSDPHVKAEEPTGGEPGNDHGEGGETRETPRKTGGSRPPPVAEAKAKALQASRLMASLAEKRETDAGAMQRIVISFERGRKLASVPDAVSHLSAFPASSDAGSSLSVQDEKNAEAQVQAVAPRQLTSSDFSVPLSGQSETTETIAEKRTIPAARPELRGIADKSKMEDGLVGLGPLPINVAEADAMAKQWQVPEFGVSTPLPSTPERVRNDRHFEAELGKLGSLIGRAETRAAQSSSQTTSGHGDSLFARIRAKHLRFASSL